jgi:head-tail adaptor
MALNVHSGELKRNVVLKNPVDARNGEGAKVRTFEPVTTARAKVTGNNGKYFGDVEPVLLNTETVIFRYSTTRSAITDEWMLEYNGADHVIHSIEFLGPERKDFIKVVCKANG